VPSNHDGITFVLGGTNKNTLTIHNSNSTASDSTIAANTISVTNNNATPKSISEVIVCQDQKTTNVNYSISGSPTIAYGGSITITATAINPQGDYI
jgi:hypothetical protein